MRILTAIRTFLAGYIIPGWGFWIVGKRELALITVAGAVGLVLVFSWTRLVLDPVAYLVLICLAMSILLVSAIYAAVIEFRRDKETAPPRNWKSAVGYALVFGVASYLVSSTKSALLGYDIFRLPASSMSPTLVRGDRILADTWHYSRSDILDGEIIVFELPGSDGVMYIKRVIGVPGDELSFDNNVLVRNGMPIEEPYAYYTDGPTPGMGSVRNIVIPDGEYFVLGDNRNNSRDSRFVGTIPRSNIIGRVTHLCYSYDPDRGVQWQRFPARVD